MSHGLHLFVKDIFAASKATRGSSVADYPEGYPLEELLLFVGKCKGLVKFFHNHHVSKAQLKSALSAVNQKMLVMMAPPRWGSIKEISFSLKQLKHHNAVRQ